MREWKSMQCVALVTALSGAGAPGCSEAIPDRAASGSWGGDHVRLSVSESGATVEFDCAHGRVDEPMRLDSQGRFDAGGTYVLEHGGPVHPGESEDEQPARYTGSVDGRTMTLSVAFGDGSRVGPFSLTLGEEGRLLKCL